MNPIDIPDDEKAASMAATRTARLQEREGLFAEFVEPVTKEQIQEAARRHRERFETTLRSLQARGEAWREQVKARVSADEFADLERRFASTPGTPEYVADFWHAEWQKLTNGSSEHPSRE